jgi:hypothetical protein
LQSVQNLRLPITQLFTAWVFSSRPEPHM